MSKPETFDCFLSYNSQDKPVVRTLAGTLRDHNISVWFDEERLRPGYPWQSLLEEAIRNSVSVAVLVGASGLGPWEEREMRAALSFATQEKRPVIPVLLPDAPAKPALPLFLQGLTWVDMRPEAAFSSLSALDRLIWGITGQRPGSADAGPSPKDADRDPAAINDPNHDQDPFRESDDMSSESPRRLPGSDGETADSRPCYITRPADLRVQALASRCCLTLVIKGPEEMGKTRVLTAYLSHCQEHGKVCAYIDFSALSQGDLGDYSSFLTALARMLRSELGQESKEPLAIASQHQMIEFMKDSIFPAVPEHLTLGLDEVDRILGRPYQADFFSMLRFWHNARARKSIWQKLDLAMVISTEPYLLIAEEHRSPFNVGEIIEIGPFAPDDCHEMNRRYGCVLSHDEVQRLCDLLGGQPQLTQTAFERLTAPDRIAFETLMVGAAEPHGPFGAHLRKLSSRLHKAPELHAALRQIITHGVRPGQPLCDRLYGAGLVRWERGRYLPANRLYASYFGGLL